MTSQQEVGESNSPVDFSNHHMSEDREEEEVPPDLQEEQSNGEW